MIRVFLIAASPLARAALQNRLKAQGVKFVGTAASVDTLGSDLSDSQADVLLVDAAGESARPITFPSRHQETGTPAFSSS